MLKTSLKDQTYSILKDRIINCIYPPGILLNENALVEELSVSRTPIRDALSRIEQEGYVTIFPKKGVQVNNISMQDVRCIFETRKAIEPIALRLSAPRLVEAELLRFRESFLKPEEDIRTSYKLDTEMHLYLFEHCDNPYLIEMMHKVFEANTRIILHSKQNEVQIHDAKKEHIKILDLLLEKEHEKAEEYLHFHLEQCEKAAVKFFYETAHTNSIGW